MSLRKLTVFRGRFFEVKDGAAFQRVCLEPGSTIYLNGLGLRVAGALVVCEGARIVNGAPPWIEVDGPTVTISSSWSPAARRGRAQPL